MLGTPSSYTDPLTHGNCRAWVEALTKGERNEVGRLVPSETPPRLCNCRLPMTTSFGEWTPTKEDPEKRKQHEKLGSGEGGQGHMEPRRS